MLGSTTTSYNAALAQAATYLSSLGETTAEVSDVGRLFSFLESQASASFPTPTLPAVVDASLPVPGKLTLAIDRTFQTSLAGRSTPGIFGLGWVTSWQASLSVDSAGNVSIVSNGGLYVFDAQPGGGYLDTDGEYGSLTASAGVYTFTNPAGIQLVFLASGQLSYQQDADGNRITLGYNGLHQLVTLTYSNPADAAEPTEQLTLTYNAQGFVATVSDGNGDNYAYGYDPAGHLTSVTAPGNLTTIYTYNTGSNPEQVNAILSITQPSGAQQNFTYDALGRLASTSQNGAAPITYGYPGEAEVTTIDAGNNTTTVWYNELGLPARTLDPRGGLASYLYDANGNLVGQTDAAGNTYQYAYDLNGNLTQTVNPLGQTVNLTYGTFGTLTALTDAAGNTTQYTYDAAGNPLSITYPGGGQESFSYDPLGNLSETVLENGDTVSYQSNAEGLVTAQLFADGTSQTFAYDAHGNLLTAKTFDADGNLTGTTTLAYNTADQLTSITYPNGQYLHFTYDATTGLRTQSVDQDGFTVNYFYNGQGQLAELKDGAGNLIVEYTYNQLGQLATKLNGNGTSTSYGYDAAGNLTSIINYASGTTVNSSFTYTYNLLGEETSMTDAANNVTKYSYDAIGELTQIALPGGQTISYVYNAAGDRIAVVNGSTTTTYASNAANEITQVGSTVYSYDANGNLHTVTDASGTTTYTFNDLNQLTSITAPDGTVTTYQYSPLGFLTGTNVGGTQTSYLVDPTGLGTVASAYDSSGSLIADYTYGLGLVSQTGPAGTGYYDFDASGNTVGITGADGSYVNQYSYLPFGETTPGATALPNPFTFAGQNGVLDLGNGLFHMTNRAYLPVTGQFVSNDPINLHGGDSNLRRYVGNDPVGHTDPSGLSVLSTLTRATTAATTGPAVPTAPDLPPPTAPPSVPGMPPLTPNANGQPTTAPTTATQSSTKGSTTNVVSEDPNALLGPAGSGTQNFIQDSGTWSYTAEFANDGSVAAQDISVTEQLDANLDWSTFQLGSFGFGPVMVTVPAGLTQYQTVVAYQNTDGTPVQVEAALDFNVATGTLTATLTSVDPRTGQAPTGVFDGFLYPDDSQGVGEGFVQYTVQPLPGLATGTTIDQQASIVFDTDAPVATNAATNTIAVVVDQTTLSEPAGTATPTATRISTLLGSHYVDPDKNTKPGIAVIAASGNGSWQYSSGAGWVNIAAPSQANALLLPQADQLRFLPAGLSTGTAQLLYVAWDGSTGSAGGHASAANLGNGNSVSTNAGQLTVTVTPVVSAPDWLANTAALAPVLPSPAVPTGQTVQAAFSGVFSADAGQSANVAVTGLTAGTNGTWEYRLFNSTTQSYGAWTNMPANVVPGRPCCCRAWT